MKKLTADMKCPLHRVMVQFQAREMNMHRKWLDSL